MSLKAKITWGFVAMLALLIALGAFGLDNSGMAGVLRPLTTQPHRMLELLRVAPRSAPDLLPTPVVAPAVKAETLAHTFAGMSALDQFMAIALPASCLSHRKRSTAWSKS